MKTSKQNKTNSNTAAANTVGGRTSLVSELKNRTEQSPAAEIQMPKQTGTEKTPEGTNTVTVTQNAPVKPYVNFAERDFNRALPTEKVLEKLKRWMPAQYELAKVVGKWVWITFPEPPPERVRAELSQLGFHWNNVRKCWQHPCGAALPRGSQEPTAKYPVYSPAEKMAA